MQALAGAGDVNALVEVVFLFAPDRGGDVARGIQRRAVALENERGGIPYGARSTIHAPSSCTSALSRALLDDGGHLIGEKALAVERIELDAEQLVGFHIFAQRNFLKIAPDGQIFLVAALQLGEGRRALDR